MRKKALPIIVCFFFFSYFACGQKENRTFTTPFIKGKNKQKGVNIYEPDFFYHPYIYIVAINPITKKHMTGRAYIDTGAHQCFISQKLANKLGLTKAEQPPIKVFTGSGVMMTYATEVEYYIADPNKEIVKGFPLQTTHFYISKTEAYEMVLGSIGFFDRFKEVRIRYPKDITFIW